MKHAATTKATAEDEIVVTVEIPRGSRNKYEYDAELEAIVLDRRLFTSTVYPADYGFVGGHGRPINAADAELSASSRFARWFLGGAADV